MARRRTCTALIALWLLPSAAAADSYYVSSSLGDDSWSGTLTEPNGGNTDGPKQSLGAAADLLNDTAQPGDEVLLRAGDVWTGSSGFVLSQAAGTEADPIVLGRYGDGGAPTLDITGSGQIILVRGSADTPSSHLRIEELVLTTSGAPGDRPVGIAILESFHPNPPHHITLRKLVIHDLHHGLNLQANDLVVEGCTIQDNFGIDPETGHTQGLYAHGDHIVVRNNVFDHNGKADSWFDWNTYLSHGSGFVYEGNEARNAVSGVKLRGAHDSVVRGNTFHGLNLVAISLGGDDSGGLSNLVVEQNLIYDCVDGITIKDQSGGGLVGVSNITVRNNVLHSNRPPTSGPLGNGYGGYLTITGDPIDGVFVFNNLIWGVEGKRNLMMSNEAPQNLRILNNIFSRSATDAALVDITNAAALDAFELDHNLYDAGGGTLLRIGSDDYADLASFTAAHSSHEAAGQSGDPELADPPNDMSLSESSTLAIDRGADATGIVDDDFAGAARPWDGDGDDTAAWDIGPYEYGSTPVGGGARAPRAPAEAAPAAREDSARTHPVPIRSERVPKTTRIAPADCRAPRRPRAAPGCSPRCGSPPDAVAARRR